MCTGRVRAKRPPDEGRLLQSVYYAYVAFSRLALALPEPIAYGLARIAGSIAARVSRKRSVVARNLARISGHPPDSPELQKLVVEAYRSYARYWLETFRAVREEADFFLERVHPTGFEHLKDRLAQGGAIVLIGHLGNWDAAGAWAGAIGWRVHTVAETLRPKRMFDFFVEHRARLGLVIYPAQAGVTARLREAVEAGALVPILGDRDLKGTGVEIDFFGEPATFPRGAAAIAMRTRVPLMFAGIRGRRMDDGRWGWGIDINPPIDLPEADDPDGVDELTRVAIGQLEDYIRAHPAEWHVFQPFWTADRR